MRVSIVSLIYQSAVLADWVHDSVLKFTPLIARGDAEFFFVANDPAPGLLAHLDRRGYPHTTNHNRAYSDDELFALGYGTPEYMSRVYRGYNEGIRHARGDYVVLVNSDNYFSPDWLENLLKYSDRTKTISSTLVERSHPKFGVFPGAVNGEFGGTVAEFDEAAFLSFVAATKKTGLRAGGAYMPTLFHRDIAIEAGLYPTGNVAGSDFAHIRRYGDEAFFDALELLGVEHLTALDSIVYHLKEGEREDAPLLRTLEGDSREPNGIDSQFTQATPYPIAPAIGPVYDPLYPNPRHALLVAGLLGKPLPRSATTPMQLLREMAVQALRRTHLLGVARRVRQALGSMRAS